MSPRAAWRLEQLGFSAVYDYTAGKVDWLAAGRPTERSGLVAPRVSSAIETGVPTCGLEDAAGPAVSRAADAGWPVCVVTNEHGIVAGRLRVANVAVEDRRPADEVMDGGPTTVRANDDLASTIARMADRHVAVLLVTTPEGTLLGALRSPL